MKEMNELLGMTNYSTRYAIEEFCNENNISDVDDFIKTEITGVINEDTYRTSEEQIQKINMVRGTTFMVLNSVLENYYTNPLPPYDVEEFDVKDYIMTNIVNNPSEKLLKMREKVS
tara:strand:+ start:177 stop:524 length:348 start_codon:yes stop_codon:yes gene_type:complete